MPVTSTKFRICSAICATALPRGPVAPNSRSCWAFLIPNKPCSPKSRAARSPSLAPSCRRTYQYHQRNKRLIRIRWALACICLRNRRSCRRVYKESSRLSSSSNRISKGQLGLPWSPLWTRSQTPINKTLEVPLASSTRNITTTSLIRTCRRWA